MSAALESSPAQGIGRIHSYTVNHRASASAGEAGPIVVAYVELAEGPRVLARIIGGEHGVQVDQTVEWVAGVVAEQDGRDHVLRFRPTTS